MPPTPPKRYLGIMSGTSLDGLDVVLTHIDGGGVQVEAGQTYPYPDTLREQLLQLCSPSGGEIERMMQVDVELARYIAHHINQFLRDHNLDAADIQAIGSHGQTIRHLPDARFPNSLQIGDPNTLAGLTGITTVADFRRRDMAAGGQGAPLVPAFHAAVFRHPGEGRVVANIGGIANITLLPATTTVAVSGFDTGPGNVLMDGWYRRHQGGSFDRGGEWARSGAVDAGLLHSLLADPYFSRTPPKSTGREHFHLDWLQSHAALAGLRPQDVQRTLCELTAVSLADAIRQHQPDCVRVLLCGGGTHNTLLTERLQALLPAQARLESTAPHGIDPDWVEGACFAWLAHQTLAGLPGNLPAVTGAARPVILGGVYRA